MDFSNKKKPLSAVSLICELTKLKCQESYLENVHSKNMLEIPLEETDSEEKRLLAEIQLDLERYEKNFECSRRESQHRIVDLKESIFHFQEMASNVQKYNLKEYRETILNIENKIVEMTNLSRLNLGKLKFENFDIASSIPSSAVLLREEKYPLVFSQLSHSFHSGNVLKESQYVEVKTFDRFLTKSGGHTGGWGEEEHSIFLGLKSKYKDNLKRIEECMRQILPGSFIN